MNASLSNTCARACGVCSVRKSGKVWKGLVAFGSRLLQRRLCGLTFDAAQLLRDVCMTCRARCPWPWMLARSNPLTPAVLRIPHACKVVRHATRCTLHAARYPLHATRCTLPAARYPLHGARRMVHATRCTLPAARCTVHAPRYTLHKPIRLLNPYAAKLRTGSRALGAEQERLNET